MRILVDADACPVVDIILKQATDCGVEVILLCDTSHELYREGARTIVVEKGTDSVDFRLVNMAIAGDLVVTQDYGLAAMCLAKGSRVLRQDGVEYTADNIDGLLHSRYVGKKIRRAGGRTKGPAPRTAEQNTQFANALVNLLPKKNANLKTENASTR